MNGGTRGEGGLESCHEKSQKDEKIEGGLGSEGKGKKASIFETIIWGGRGESPGARKAKGL